MDARRRRSISTDFNGTWESHNGVFSTGGYDYLGKQLASRGFTFISVDEDFINYSNVSGAPNDNYELRAWMLLQHLLQLKDLNKTEDSLFAGKIDFNHVGLAGHSRGGQA